MLRTATRASFWIILFCGLGCVTASQSPKTGGSPGLPRRFALLVGVNNYRSKGIPSLRGPGNDVKSMKALLMNGFQFQEQNIHTLLDGEATYMKIRNEFESFLIKNAKKRDDIVVFYFSGHGSRAYSAMNPSDYEETIVPYDSRDSQNLDITSKALSSFLRELAKSTKNITVILDSCNSGRVVNPTRSVQSVPNVRSILAAKDPAPPPPIAGGAVRAIGSDEQQLFSPLDDSYVFLAAALAKQDAHEYPMDNPRYGIFTYFLTRELQRAKAGATYLEVMRNVQQQVNSLEENQLPQVVGPNRIKSVFNITKKELPPYQLVVSSSAPQGKVIFPYAGEPFGITVGSKYEVYGPDEDKFDNPKNILAALEIETVTASSAVAKVTSGTKVADYSRAVLTDFKLPGQVKMRVWIQNNPQSKTLAHINETLTQFSQVELSSDFESSNLVVVEKNGEITLRTPDDVPLGIPRPANDDAAVQIGHDILKWAHWFYLMSMDNPGSPLKVELTVSKKGTRGETRGLDQIGKAEMTFKAGETASIVVTNSSTRKLYVTVLALSTDGTVAVLLPDSAQQGAAVELAPGKSYPPIEPTASIPECISSTRDIIKVIATSVPVDLRELEQSTSVCSRSTTRNLTSKNAGDLLAGTSVWTTVRKVVEVVP